MSKVTTDELNSILSSTLKITTVQINPYSCTANQTIYVHSGKRVVRNNFHVASNAVNFKRRFFLVDSGKYTPCFICFPQ